MADATKMDEVSVKFQMAIDPPLFSKNYIALFFFNVILKKPCLEVQNLQHKFLDWKLPPSLPPLEILRKFICFGGVIRP